MRININYKKILNDIAYKEQTFRPLSDKESKQLKECLFEMAVDIDKCCRKNNITLFLTGGSLLGAVRHRGFIPWDDDMDLGLMRKDYEKFKKIFYKELGDRYEMRCPNSACPNGNRFMQIYKKGTVLKTIEGNNPLQPNSVSIDIFPYDYVPQNLIRRAIKGIIATALMLIASCVMNEKYMNITYRNFLSKSKDGKIYLLLRRWIGRIFLFRTPESWFDKVDKQIQYHKKTNLLTSATGRKHYFHEIYSRDVFIPFVQLEFNGHNFFAPGKYEIYLNGNYGNDYMFPPKDAKRESHFITEFRV